MESLICAVDVGTASARAGLFDRSGYMIVRHVAPFEMTGTLGGIAEMSSEGVWRAVAAAARGALAEARAGGETRPVAGLAFDATCSLVLRQKGGAPLEIGADGADTIAWMDHRGTAEAEEIAATADPALAFAGGSMHPEMQLPKLLWLKRHRPLLWDRLGSARDLVDFLTWRATGSEIRSLCAAAAKWGYCPGDGGWPEALFARIGLEDLGRAGGLPRHVAPPGTRAGTLTALAATELGLPIGCPVAVGMVDAYAGTLGLLGRAPEGGRGGHAALIAGTSACVMGVSAERPRSAGLWGPVEGAVLPGLWSIEGGQSAAGALLDWVLQTFGAGSADIAAHEATLARIETLLIAEGPDLGSDIHVLTGARGRRMPRPGAEGRAGIIGLGLGRGADDAARIYWRAATALALGMGDVLGEMDAAGQPVRVLHAAGGVRRSPLLMQLYADATGREVRPSGAPDAVLLGTAMLGASAAGLYPGPGAAAASMGMPAGTPITPRAERAGRMEADRKAQTRLRSVLRDLAP
ncbi:FGGY-family carbohydrate kinase [Tropicimonas sp. IMCC34011]|uniref:FGGY-family carbohydrate kinase n=1 Tax=Tropicimonas sp. IMCC34011 TaxID=2248759 RepID=UPI000E27149E|nr:FGGY-family carbohydrate kinase [Tropicimonas sp. IMCC34011]